MTTLWQSQGDVFEIFPWNHNFETGLDGIDEQHWVLVNILNRLAWQCASYHFKYEERVWEEALGKSEMVQNHHDSHQMFFAQVQMLRQSKAPQEDVLAELFDYLTCWLVFHILESDRRMALTIKASKTGSSDFFTSPR